MDTNKKIGSEITVRISLTFQDAPDVHTLLAMTPVRQRGKLVRLALERYIRETGHVSGSVHVQIEAISSWLKQRNGQPDTEPTHQEKLALKTHHYLNNIQENHYDPTSAINNMSEINILNEDKKSENQGKIVDSASMKRWLDS